MESFDKYTSFLLQNLTLEDPKYNQTEKKFEH